MSDKICEKSGCNKKAEYWYTCYQRPLNENDPTTWTEENIDKFWFCSEEHCNEVICYDDKGNVNIERTKAKIEGGKNG